MKRSAVVQLSHFMCLQMLIGAALTSGEAAVAEGGAYADDELMIVDVPALAGAADEINERGASDEVKLTDESEEISGESSEETGELPDVENASDEPSVEIYEADIKLDGGYTHFNSGPYYTRVNYNVAYTAELNNNQKNIVRRARLMAEALWTPQKTIYSWGGNDQAYFLEYPGDVYVVATDGTVTTGCFQEGKTYRGLPYSQAVNTGYIGQWISIDNFISAVNNPSSKFYSGYSTYRRTAPYYGTDCSCLVAWAWGFTSLSCKQLANSYYSRKLDNALDDLRVGDALNNLTESHIVLVTNIGYDVDGNICSVEITEAYPPKVSVSCYGELLPGRAYDAYGTLEKITEIFFDGGFNIYRRSSYRANVKDVECSSVDLDAFFDQGTSYAESLGMLDATGYLSARNTKIAASILRCLVGLSPDL